MFTHFNTKNNTVPIYAKVQNRKYFNLIKILWCMTSEHTFSSLVSGAVKKKNMNKNNLGEEWVYLA